MNEKQTISVKELSQRLGISLPKAYELVETKIPHIKVGSRILIDIEVLDDWLKKNSTIKG